MKTCQHNDTGLFPAFARAEAREKRERTSVERERRIDEHRASMKCCWPEWSGPITDSPGSNGFLEVGGLTPYSLTHEGRRYHYMAPCRVESVSADGLTVIAVVEYREPGPCRDRYNGERLRLDITEIWPPVRLLSAHRRDPHGAAATAERAAT